MQLETRIDGEVLLLGMSNPPVNCLSLALREQLHAAFTLTARQSRIESIILYGAGKYFCAGGDLRELGTPASSAAPRLSADILHAIEGCAKPVIAALHGAAIGGGFELALACHYRIADCNTRIALPEVKHGIIPLSGTLRLPRLWGIARSLSMMLDARTSAARDFQGSGVFDHLVTVAGDECEASREVLTAALSFARSRPRARVEDALVRNRPFTESDPGRTFTTALEYHAGRQLTAAQHAVIAAVRLGIETPDFDAALAGAQGIYDGLLAPSATSASAAAVTPYPKHT